MIDVNVSLSRWPFRRLAGDETPELVAALRRHGVTQAWAGSFDGILHKDIAGVNSRLARDCAAHGKGLLVAFGSVNPKLPDWREDLRRCFEEHKMAGIRLHPNYHGYELTDPVFAAVLSEAAARGMIVQLALRMEDERMQHPLMRVPPADPKALPEMVKALPGLRLVVMHWKGLLGGGLAERLASSGEVYFEISMLDGLGALAGLVSEVSAERVLFGSNFPLFYFEAAALKVREAGLSNAQEQSLLEANAKRLLGINGRRQSREKIIHIARSKSNSLKTNEKTTASVSLP